MATSGFQSFPEPASAKQRDRWQWAILGNAGVHTDCRAWTIWDGRSCEYCRRVLCETHGKGPIRAKMRAIVFKAYRGVV